MRTAHTLTAGIGRRIATHRRQKSWWAEPDIEQVAASVAEAVEDIARIDVEHYEDRPSVVAAERAAIESERPRLNVHHGHRRIPSPADGRVYSERHARRLRRGK